MNRKLIYLLLGIIAVGVLIIFAIRIWSGQQETKINQEAEKQQTEMLAKYNQFLSQSKKNSRQLILSALNFAKMGYYNFAIVTLEKVVQIDPNYRDGLVAYGSVVLKKCETEKKCEKVELVKVKSALERAAEVDPLDPTPKKYLEIVKTLNIP